MSIRERKAQAREFLENRDLDGLVAWAKEMRSPLRSLISLAFDPHELIRWRTVEAVGRVAATLGKRDLETVRELVRRLLWLMNDESGGLCRLSPEMIGETLVQVPEVTEEYAGILPSFLIEEPFERGTHWAVWRLAPKYPKLLGHAIKQLNISLADNDPAIRAYAGLSLAAIDPTFEAAQLDTLRQDEAALTEYDRQSGNLVQISVSERIRKGLVEIEAAGQAA